MSKRRGLGKGLEALLGTTEETLVAEATPDELKRIPVDLIRPGRYQPRRDMAEDKLEELADSIRAQGVVQPIVVRPIEGVEGYEIIAGERRWRATQKVGLHDIPAVIKDVPDETAIAMALIENIQREDLNPLEESMALQRLIDEFDLTHQQAAEAVGRSRAAVSNILRLLDLQPTAKDLLQQRKLDMGHARALLALAPELQGEAANQVALMGLSVRETEALVKKLQNPPPKKEPTRTTEDPDVRRLREEISETLGAAVEVRHKDDGKGKLVIRYTSLDELDGILERLQHSKK